MAVLANCKPQDVFKYFEMICGIPHGSWNEKALSDALLAWAKDLGLEAHQDDMWNLIIKKPATAGYENSPAVILQAHIDMVCEKNADVEFDFDTQGIDIYIDGDFVKARGTTLGGDNGIGAAMGMAVLADNTLQHPAIELVLTTVEEAGMDGAKAIDASLLKGKVFINIDNSDEGIFITGCAGGARINLALSVEWAALPTGDFVCCEIFVGGLKGGHSGMDIHLERGNSNKLLVRALHGLSVPFYISEIGGGSKDNAIPREAWSKIYVANDDKGTFLSEIATLEAILQKEYSTTEPELSLQTKAGDVKNCCEKVFSEGTQKSLINLLLSIPSGIEHYSADVAGLVETSNNMGVIRMENDKIVITNAVRSSVETRKHAICSRIVGIAKAMGADAVVTDGYPGWQYAPISPIRDTFVDIWTKKFGKAPKTMAIHAGLECGVFAEKLTGLDMISFGPDIFDLHTPDERASISSTERCYEFLKDVLEQL
ncbi:MAG: aminoacyl-histidine dipeptidase [Defluviitaleaceae bacterium]|nr:aminoacyl-histidine dipeptidase [Defluviitaleaceae bacterium]